MESKPDFSARHASRARAKSPPELEGDFNRSPHLGYEPIAEVGFIRCLSHGFPTPLARWHCHDEYELHINIATTGKAFVGDWIGPFFPGHMVLCGPKLPHNWISTDLAGGCIERRDLVIQFQREPIEDAGRAIPEMAEILPLLERSRHGIEFFGFSAAEAQWSRVKAAKGMRRLTAFLDFITDLARWSDYRLLSSIPMQGPEDGIELDQINSIVNHINENVAQALPAAEVAQSLGMSDSRFSRFFRRATGNSYSDFVNQVRINRACQLLMSTEQYVTNICYDVGFNNVANFNRRFRELKGFTPSEFRKQAESRFGGGA